MDDPDQHLLERYCRGGDQSAFGELLRRHLNLVHSIALRHVQSAQLAEEVAQSVFIQLARQPRSLAPHTILPAWLWQVARRKAIDVARREARRKFREHAAYELATMNSSDADWTRIEPFLDEALQSLPDADRAIVILRWFEGKSLREIAAATGASEDAVQKRSSRALDRLRGFFSQRGVSASSGALAVALTSNAVLSAPAGLAAVLANGVLASGATAETGWFAAFLTAFFAMSKTTKVALAVALIAILAIPVSRYLQPAAQTTLPGTNENANRRAPPNVSATPIENPPAQSDTAKSDPAPSPPLAEAVAQLLQTPPSPLGTLSGTLSVKLNDQEITNRIAISYGATTSFVLANGIIATIVAMKDPNSDFMFYDVTLQGTSRDGKPIWTRSMLTGTSGKPVADSGSFSFTPD